MPRRIVLYIATSADGLIARKDGSVDWLESRPAEDYDGVAFFARVDTIVWGRRTYDESASRGGVAPFGASMRHVVLTHRDAPPDAPENVAFTREPVEALARRLRAEQGKDVWLMGGAGAIAAFLAADALDQIVVHVIPVLLGEGIPLVAGLKKDVQLALRESHAYPDGVVRLTYDVVRRAPAPRPGPPS